MILVNILGWTILSLYNSIIVGIGLAAGFAFFKFINNFLYKKFKLNVFSEQHTDS